MKKIQTLIIIFFISFNSNAQQYYQLYYNTDLNNQVAVNQVARLLSEKSYQKSYQKQVDEMEKVKESMVKVLVMKEMIYKQLHNVNSALKQGKYVEIIYNDFAKLLANMGIMVDLTAQNPQYAILITRFYEKILLHGTNAYTGIADQVQREETNYLMDSADRRTLLHKLHTEIRTMNGFVLYINNYLRNAKKKPYFRHFQVLNSWYIQDKALIQNIINNSNQLIN